MKISAHNIKYIENALKPVTGNRIRRNKNF